jgi:hypothetical protein
MLLYTPYNIASGALFRPAAAEIAVDSGVRTRVYGYRGGGV